MVNAGHARNALPGMAKANVNCRILPGHSQEEIRQRLIAIFDDPKLTVSYVTDAGEVKGVGSAKKSMEPPPVREDVFGPLHELAAEMWPGVPVVPVMSTGASDSIFTMAAGIPSYGISGMGVDFNDDRAHGRDERIRVGAFYQGVEFRYLYMKALTR
jgi:acetylornithine deacetylase/succinyl-diaminopimelate desuccinylase-like protein